MFAEVKRKPNLAVTKDRWPAGQGSRGKYGSRGYPYEDPALAASILAQLAKGHPVRACALAAGIRWRDWRRWEVRGDAGEEPHASWYRQVHLAQGQGQAKLLDTVVAAGEGAPDQHGVWRSQWQASRWLLERGDPEAFAVMPATQVQVEVRGEPDLDLSRLTTAELEDLYLLTAKAGVAEQAIPEDSGVWVEVDAVPKDSVG